MKFAKSVAIFLAVLAPVSFAKNKKKDTLPAVFSNARFVYVQAEDGDILKPGLFPEDREAIANVQDALKDWNRYALTLHRNDADLIIIVRRGRLASAQLHGGVTAGNQPVIGGSYPRRNPAGAGSSAPGDDPDRTDRLIPSEPGLKLDQTMTRCACSPLPHRENSVARSGRAK